MPQTGEAAVLSQTLQSRGRLPVTEAVAVFRQLLAEVGRLHQAGRIHRAIRLESIFLDADSQVVLAEPAALVAFSGPDADRDACPPEARLREPLALPVDAAAAETILTQAGIDVSPQRFDVYQLGVVLLRMVTGQHVDSYLRSPRVKSQVPDGLQRLITGALGFADTERMTRVSELAAALDQPAVRVAETPPRGSAAASPWPPASEHGDTPVPVAPAPAATRAGQPLERLGHYRIVSRIGQGGMGDVYLGFEEELQRQVAIKVLPVELARSEILVRRFLAEAAAVAQIAHPHVVPIYFIGHDADRHFYAMQYVEGESLDRLLAAHGRLRVAQTLTIVEQCLAGLQAVHQAGLVHRDIKPANILIDAKTQRALVADFGLVKGNGGGPTATGVVLGTVDYMAPEVARGQKADARCDLYAVGVMAYQMLSGRLPFAAETPTAVLFQHAYEQPPSLRTVAPDVPHPVVDFVDRLMAKDPADRFADCAAAVDGLRRCRTNESTRPAPSVPAAPALDAPLSDLVLLPRSQPRPWWQQVRDQISELLFGQRGPAPWLGSTTVQDVDGAVADCAARRDRLAGLLADAQSAAQALAAPSAPGAAGGLSPNEAAQTVAELENTIRQLRSELAEADATLARLRGQRDLLKARLRAAGSERQPRWSDGPRRLLAGGGLIAGGGLGLVVLLFALRQGDADAPVAIVPALDAPVAIDRLPVRPAPAVSVPEPSGGILLPAPAVDAVPGPEEADANRAVAMALLDLNATLEVAPLFGRVDSRQTVKNRQTLASIQVPFFLNLVELQGTHVNDDTLRLFAGRQLRGVETFRLTNTNVGGPGLRHVARSMPYLRSLNLRESPITDAGFAELGPLPNLRVLVLQGTLITDRSMEGFDRWPELTVLNLRKSAVTAASFRKPDQLPKLLNFIAPPAFDDSVMPFVTGKPLTVLDLTQTKVTSAGLIHLPQTPKFMDVRLSGPAIDERTPERLAAFSSLKLLWLDQTVSPETVAQIKAALPQLRIHQLVMPVTE